MIEPAVGSITPVSMLIIVLLPAPFGPISAWMWPALQRKDTSCAGFTPPKALVDAFDDQQLAARARRRCGVGLAALRPDAGRLDLRLPEPRGPNRPVTPPGMTYSAKSSREPFRKCCAKASAPAALDDRQDDGADERPVHASRRRRRAPAAG